MLKIDENIKKQIIEVLENQDVTLAYVFGSHASGKVSALSDFDLAVLFSKDVGKEEYFNKELKIAGDIGRIMRIDRVDVINLAMARNPLLKHNAIFESMPILVKDNKVKFNLERIIRQEYEDTKYLRETSYKIMRRQIKNGTFGKPKIYVAGK